MQLHVAYNQYTCPDLYIRTEVFSNLYHNAYNDCIELCRKGDHSTCYQYAGSVSNPFQGLITVQVEAIDSVMCDSSIGVEWRDPAHLDGGGADVLIGHLEH